MGCLPKQVALAIMAVLFCMNMTGCADKSADSVENVEVEKITGGGRNT